MLKIELNRDLVCKFRCDFIKIYANILSTVRRQELGAGSCGSYLNRFNSIMILAYAKR